MISSIRERRPARRVHLRFEGLIHDLGAVRAFVDEAEAVPEASSSEPVASVRDAMEAATIAITRIFNDPTEDQRIVEAAWQAMARAQDAVRAARVIVVSARTARETAVSQSAQAREQRERALGHADALAQQMDRLRRPRG
jgi:hypothetical protein